MSDFVRANEGCADERVGLWDTVWDATEGRGDWALAEDDETGNQGGLRAKAALETAIVLSLFTDRRVDPQHPLAWLADGDNRGWWGDGVGDDEPLGSLLWLLERSPLTGPETERWAVALAEESLAGLVGKGAAVRLDVEATAVPLHSRLELLVRLYGRDGALLYDRRFDMIWRQHYDL